MVQHRRRKALAYDARATPSFAVSLILIVDVKSVIFWSAAALLLFGQFMIVRAWWAGRTPAAGAVRRPRAREFVWITLPVVVLAVTLVATWRAQRDAVPNQAQDIHAEHAS